ncbi:hypothetical protein EDD29_2640 [Actinocorallia herbida]|uniref:DUF1622 domain-containing protein n=1 Tax=Actinocorallia herbida TaxID=58109 RepID=A0A3N1CV38_9ACTN|nr:hypothetical protein [Actinocorallia herbida]ROO85105.1 hypothetical protein EDD29_2640 [Actinocorallia herbida]
MTDAFPLWVRTAALACVAAGLVAGAVTAVVSRDGQTGLKVALDFWLAAGLLNLGVAPGWEGPAVAASILVVRRLVGATLARPAVRFGDVLRPPAAPRPRPPADGP